MTTKRSTPSDRIRSISRDLLCRVLEYYDTRHDHDLPLFDDVAERTRTRGFMNKSDFLTICIWKTPRPKRHYRNNHHRTISSVTKSVLSTSSEEFRVNQLKCLHGVGIPVASALLTAINYRNYGVIDIRVWQTLLAFGLVKGKPKGVGFLVDDWLRYLSVLREIASYLEIPVRRLEICLFWLHQDWLEKRKALYGATGISKPWSVGICKKRVPWLFDRSKII